MNKKNEKRQIDKKPWKTIIPTHGLLLETMWIVNELMQRKGLDDRCEVKDGKLVWKKKKSKKKPMKKKTTSTSKKS